MEELMEMIHEHSSEAEVSQEATQTNRDIYSLENKLAILDAVDKGVKQIDVAKDFGIPQSTLNGIVRKQRKKIISAGEAMLDSGTGHLPSGSSQKRLRMTQYADLDKALAAWCREVQSEGMKLNGPMVEVKARELATELNHTKFACSKGWMARFKHRYGITFKRTIERTDLLQHIQKDAEVNLGNGAEDPDLAAVLQAYQSCDVYCVHALTLFWRALPAQGFEKFQQVLADKDCECVTLLMACNVDGSKKLPLRAILKAGQDLMCLMKMKSQCPVQYTYSDTAVLTPEIFIEWIQHLDSLFKMEERQVCFLLNPIASFPRVKGLERIQLLHLPKHSPNPCLQGIAQYLQIAYRLEVIHRATAAISDHPKGTSFVLTLVDALRVLRDIWRSIPAEVVQKAFLKAGFVLQVALDTFASTLVYSPPPSLAMNESSLLDKIKKNFTILPNVEKLCLSLGLQCLHTVDSDLVRKNKDSIMEDGNSEGRYVSTTCPTPQEASIALETLKQFFSTRNVSNACDVDESLEIIEGAVKVVSGQVLPNTDIVMKFQVDYDH